MEWSIQEVARAAGTTSRALRHYGELGLLEPSRIGHNGYRYYDSQAIVRLQRILMLRELGLGLAAIHDVLARVTDEAAALAEHVRWLESERARIERQLTAVRRTIASLEHGTEMDMNDMLDGFDHTQYEEEVAQRWGRDAAKRSSDWWARKSPKERAEWQQRLAELNQDWQRLAVVGADPAGDEAQALAARHVEWLTGIPGTPAEAGDTATRDAYVLGLADMYVADERFAANYGGEVGASFVRDALRAFVAVS